MTNESITINNLDNYLNDFLKRGSQSYDLPLSSLDIENLYIEHLAKAYDMVFEAIEPGVLL